MTLPQLFKFLTFLMALLGTISLLVFGHYADSPGTGLLVLVALFAGLFFWESKVHTPAWELVWKSVAVVFACYIIVDSVLGPLASIEARVVKHAANLSIFLVLFKICNRKTARDYKQIYLISFFQFVSCTTLTTSFGFLFLFALYVVVALWTLSLFHIRNQIEQHKVSRRLGVAAGPTGSELFGTALGSSSTPGIRSVLGPGYFAVTFVLAIGILLTALAMFFLFPRRGIAGIGRMQNGGSVTGLSGEVNLDQFGRISQDKRIVMEVMLPDRPPPSQTVLWRAGALAFFDGQLWQKAPPGVLDRALRRPTRIPAPYSRSYMPEYTGYPTRYRGADRKQLMSRAELWEQRVSVQPGHGLFLISATNPPVLIDSDVPLLEEYTATFRFAKPQTAPVSYTVFSEFGVPSERALVHAGSVADHPDADYYRRVYVERTPLSPASLAVLHDDIKIDKYVTPYEKIMAIDRYLTSRYVYTLDIERPKRGVSPIEHFLVHTKAGHCEYFATAMAVLLKECGIPARLAFGYMTTPESWNKFFGGSCAIRQCDAHAWVEAALVIDGEVRWVPFDPSPRRAAARMPVSPLGRFVHGVAQFFEGLKARWHESIIAFDRRYQNRVAARIEQTLIEMRRSALGTLRATERWISWLWGRLTRTPATAVLTPVALACSMSAGIILIVRRLQRRVRFRRAYVENKPERQARSVRFYERMLRMLLQYDIVKPAELTPREFATALGSYPELQPAVGGLTDLYYAVRFGDRQLTGKQIGSVHEALGRVGHALRLAGQAKPKLLDTLERPQ